jgi:3-methyl-2-oxobutanoate hydroxymethyltransferase
MFSNELATLNPAVENPHFSCVSNRRITLEDLSDLHLTGIPITVLVLYDEKGALLADQCLVDVVVVSYSHGGPAHLPNEETATLDDIVLATQRVRSVNGYSYIVADLPGCFYPLDERAVNGALALVGAGADAVKIEGGYEAVNVVGALSAMGVNVVAHVGYMPKTKMAMRRRGKTPMDCKLLLRDSIALQNAGAVALVTELVDCDAAKRMTMLLKIPTLGVYSGRSTSGQVLVLDDLLDVTVYDQKHFPKGKPKSIGRWFGMPRQRVVDFVRYVKSRKFPS